jgi:hypothetical protein
MSVEIDNFLTEWHRVVSEKDHGSLGRLLAPEVMLGAPPYWDKFQGYDIVHHLLGLILDTIEDFTYHRQWRDGREIALEFTGHIGQLDLQGIDLITLNDRFVVGNLDVLIRPTNAVDELREIIAPKMASFFARSSKGAA